MRDLIALPKVELHVHLENTVRLDGPLPPLGSFEAFFAYNDLVRSALQTADDFRRIAVEFCEGASAQGTRYAEVSFTAAAHGERVGDLDMPLDAVIEGLALGKERYGLEVRLLLDHSRRRPVERAWRTLELALAHRSSVVAVGLAGDEAHPGEPFVPVFDAAHEAGLHVVHHAGEAQGPESIRQALDNHTERLGHGIRLLEDPALLAEVRSRRIPLEVCPSSNVALGFVPSLTAHPLPRLLDAGLAVTVNTDIPAAIGTCLVQEYAAAREVFGLDDVALADLARSGVHASFAPDDLKVRLLDEINAWLCG